MVQCGVTDYEKHFLKALPVKIGTVDGLCFGDPDTSGNDWLLLGFLLSWLAVWFAPFSEINLLEVLASE